MAISFHSREGPMAKRPKAVHQLTLPPFEAMFPDEDACKAYWVARRWPQGVRCPRCGNPAVYDLPSRKWHWQCEKCTQTVIGSPISPGLSSRTPTSRSVTGIALS